MTVVWFVAAAAVATVLRAVLTADPSAGAIPWRTLAINTVGAALLGFVMTTSWWSNTPLPITVGALGSLTTFSTVAGETAALLDDGNRRVAAAYVAATLIAGIAAAWVGIEIGAQT